MRAHTLIFAIAGPFIALGLLLGNLTPYADGTVDGSTRALGGLVVVVWIYTIARLCGYSARVTMGVRWRKD